MTARNEIEERSYCTRRAREERQKAAICEDNSAALVHLKLAEEYERRVRDTGPVQRIAATA